VTGEAGASDAVKYSKFTARTCGGCEPIHYTLTTPTTQCSGVGPYPIVVVLDKNPNYDVTVSNGRLTIGPRPVEVTADPQTKSFASPDPTLTYRVTKGSLVCNDQFAGALGRMPGETVTGGPYAIIQNTLTLGPNYGVSFVGASLTITTAQTTASLTFTPNPRQYSDVVQFTATIPNGFLNGTQAVSTVTVNVGPNVVGTIPLGPSGSSLTGTLSVALLEPIPFGIAPGAAPGSYPVAATLGSVNPNYTVGPPQPGTLVITPEDARAKYTGPTSVTADDPDDGSSSASSSYPSSSSNQATIALSATIRDISATADAAGDASFGDIRNATVTFVDRGNGNAAIATVPVGLVSPGDTKTGTAAYDWTVDIGSAASKRYTVGFVVNRYYTRNQSSDDVVITVSEESSNYITGSGSIVLANPSGLSSGDAGSRCDVLFDLKHDNGVLQGSFKTTLNRGGHVIQLSGVLLTSLATQAASPGGAATFTGKASLVDVTSSTTLDDDASLQVSMADLGAGPDWIAISVWNKRGGLWFANNWDGTSPVQTTLSSGNLQFYAGASSALTRVTPTREVAPQPTAANVPLEYALLQNFPNPFTDGTSIRFDLPERSRVTLAVYDVMGREVASLVDEAIDPGRHVATWSGRTRAGGPAEAGVYFVRMIASAESGTGRFRSDKRIALMR